MNDKWIRLIGIPCAALLMLSAYDGWAGYTAPGVERRFLGGVLSGFTLWEGNRLIFIAMRRWFPRYQQTARRLVVQTLASVAFTFANTAFLHGIYPLLLGIPLGTGDALLVSFLLNLVPTLFVTSLYESAYFFRHWKENLLRSEALARANLQSELDLLRSQLDPHFMFNSLNTLAAVIEGDNELAHTYLEQLADVYRYVLLSRHQDTVPLAEEMAFVQAYVFLNKTRFRDDLQVEQDIAPAAYATRVAPLSVQLLVENALKHNVVSPERPLCVRVFTEEGNEYVRVQNNVQLRTTLSSSTRVGLRNLISRYQLLSAAPVEVLREDGLFTVRVPLLP
ncbi:histidine kinase [Hymenobacter sp. YC55]|uniref:sensor histidine kinase n=1 Tax=Hymenobacter sp. YC55 TaxID=3034019 RepID=UPI0023F862FA|nr:histidine kinase [Hymenobacter sp. YC55]MDF7815081.1 histidine kinase [Hymenobacter sp. YC55]